MSKSDYIGKILIVDDEESMREMLDIMLSKVGYEVSCACSYGEALKFIQGDNFDLVVSDIKMPDSSGLELLKKIRSMNPDLPVIIITAYASLDSALVALREGAFDYINKPFEVNQIKFSIKRALENKRLRDENRILRQHIKTGIDPLDNFIGKSKKIREIKELVAKIAPTDSSVLITGESGTGKEVLSRAIHKLSTRRDGAFIAINCGAVPETLLESELFGHLKGSFTGAVKDQEGLFQAASGGTFFLDEIGTVSPPIQVKLLRALEEKEITPIGSTKVIDVDVRIIAATNADLALMVNEGDFRNDLYYRLNVLNIHIPPLRERREDIIPIASFILNRLATRTEEKVKSLSKEAAAIIENAPWKGNVRELENALERALLLTDEDEITPEALPRTLTNQNQTAINEVPGGHSDNFLPSMEVIEKSYIYWVLKSTNWKKSKAADILGIDTSTLYRKIEKYDLKEHIED